MKIHLKPCKDTVVIDISTCTQLEFLLFGEQALPKICFIAPARSCLSQDLLHWLIQPHGSDPGVSVQ